MEAGTSLLGTGRGGGRLFGERDGHRHRRDHLRAEPVEKRVRHLLCGSVDQPCAELGNFAADLGVDLVTQQGGGTGVLQVNLGAALGEACDAALALAADRVPVRRVDVGQVHRTAEPRRDRADLHRGSRLHVGVRQFLQALAARNAGLEHRRVIERLPYGLARRLDAPLTCHVHWTEFRCARRTLLAGSGACNQAHPPWHGGCLSLVCWARHGQFASRTISPGIRWPRRRCCSRPSSSPLDRSLRCLRRGSMGRSPAAALEPG